MSLINLTCWQFHRIHLVSLGARKSIKQDSPGLVDWQVPVSVEYFSLRAAKLSCRNLVNFVCSFRSSEAGAAERPGRPQWARSVGGCSANWSVAFRGVLSLDLISWSIDHVTSASTRLRHNDVSACLHSTTIVRSPMPDKLYAPLSAPFIPLAVKWSTSKGLIITSVCLSAGLAYTKSYGRIWLKFSGKVRRPSLDVVRFWWWSNQHLDPG